MKKKEKAVDDKFELKQKIKNQARQINDDIEEKLESISFKEKLKSLRSFFKNADKEVHQKYKKLPKRTRRAFLIAVIAAAYPTLKIANTVYQNDQDLKQQEQMQKLRRDFKENLTRRRVISDKTDFDALYKDALGLIELSMFPTECLVLSPYSDNNKKVCNTIGLGSYYYPKDGNPESSEWIKASQYFKLHGKQNIEADKALDLVNGWFCHREGGRALTSMYNILEGAALTAHEFAAIASVMYNSESKGRALCHIVKDNYQNPMLCAQKIAELSVKKGFNGLARRHLHEAYLYLNLDDYLSKMCNFKVQKSAGDTTNFSGQTSVFQLPLKDVKAGQKAISSGDVAEIIKEQSKIVNYNVENALTIGDIIRQNVANAEHRNALLAFDDKTISFEDAKEAMEKDDSNKSFKIAEKFAFERTRQSR